MKLLLAEAKKFLETCFGIRIKAIALAQIFDDYTWPANDNSPFGATPLVLNLVGELMLVRHESLITHY